MTEFQYQLDWLCDSGHVTGPLPNFDTSLTEWLEDQAVNTLFYRFKLW